MSKSKITGKVLAVQFGRRETQIVLVNGSEILHGVSVPTPSGAVEDGVIRNPDAVRDLLKTAIKEEPQFRRVRQVVFSICTSQVITERVTVPALPTAKLEKLLQANMDMYFPVDVHDYHLVWQLIGPKENGGDTKEVNVQLWAFPVALLKRYYNVGNECGLSVAAVDYCGHSLCTAVGVSFTRPEKKAAKSRKKRGGDGVADFESTQQRAVDTELHVLMEQELLGMTFVQNGQVVLQRCIRCGSQPSYQFGELAMMLEYFRSMDIGRGSTIRGIASGVYASDSYMIEELQDALGIPFMRLAVDYDIRWVLCAGAARTDLEFGMPSMNAPGKTRTDIQGQLWQYAMILGGGLAVLAVVALILSSRLTWSSEIAAKQNEQNILMQQSAKYSGNYDNYVNYKNAYNSYSNDWDTIFANLNKPNDDLVRVMEELENIMPAKSSVQSMSIFSNNMQILFACENKEEAAYLMSQLRRMSNTYIGETPDYTVVFSELTGGGKGAAKTYGTQDAQDKVEAPPTQGSATIGEIALNTADNLVKALSKGGSLEKLSFDDLGLLNETYGQVPNLDADTFPAWDAVSTDTEEYFDERVEAMDKMFSENPFAVHQLIETLRGKKSELMNLGYGWDMMVIEPNLNKIMDFPDDLKGAREYKTKFNRVFYQTMNDDGDDLIDSTKRLADTEKLLSGSKDLMKIYKYYLAMELDGSVEVERSYLDVSAIEADLSQYGQFHTQKDSLDKQLNKLIWKEPESTEPGGTTPDDTDPTETEPTETEPTETEPTEDDRIENIKLMLNLYLMSGGTGNEVVDELLQEYVDTGKISKDAVKDAAENLDVELSDEDIDKIHKSAEELIEDIEKMDEDDYAEIADITKDFLKEVQKILDKAGATDPTGGTTDPTSGTTDPTESTGETVPIVTTPGSSGQLDRYQDASVEQITKWLKTYITSLTGDCGDSQEKIRAGVNAEIKYYFENGTGNPQYLTKTIDSVIKATLVDKEIKEVFKNCYMHKFDKFSMTHPLVVKIFEYLEKDGSCGNDVLDACFQRCLNSIHADIFGDMLAGADSSGNKGGAVEPVDTRVFFTAFLTYVDKDVPVNQVDRKGLAVEDKIPELIVNVEGDN